MTPPRKGSTMRSWPSRRITAALFSVRPELVEGLPLSSTGERRRTVLRQAQHERLGRMASWDSRLHRHESREQDADRVHAHRGPDLAVGAASVDTDRQSTWLKSRH